MPVTIDRPLNRLDGLRQRVRAKLDEPSAGFWGDSELTEYVNEGYELVWEMIVSAYEGHFLKRGFIDWVQDQAEYELPPDFFKHRIVERRFGDGTTQPLMHVERHEQTSLRGGGRGTLFLPRYRYLGQRIIFEPAPSDNENRAVQFDYVPQLQRLEHDTNQLHDGIDRPGIRLIILWAVIQAKEKQEGLFPGTTGVGVFNRSFAKEEKLYRDLLEQRSMAPEFVRPWGIEDNDEGIYSY